MFLGVVACVEDGRRISSPRSTSPVVTVDLELHGAFDARDGAARHHLQPVLDQLERHPGIRNIEAQTMAGPVRAEDLFPAWTSISTSPSPRSSRPPTPFRALMPPGIQAPLVVQFNASSVPVLQISLSSDTLSEQQLYDYGHLSHPPASSAPIPGITLPTPSGGKYRQIMVDIDPNKLLAKGLTPLDVVNAVNAQNLTLPAGHREIRPGRNMSSAPMRRRPRSTISMIFPIKGRERRHRLRQGCRPRSHGRLAGAAECGAAERPPFGAAQRHQERQTPRTLTVVNGRAQGAADCGRRGGAGRACRSMNCSISPCFVKNSVASVLREGREFSGCADGTDDPAVPGVVAFDARGHDPRSRSPFLSSLVVAAFPGAKP